MNPKVSVIVPIYNTGCFLSKCIDSILLQTLNDIEIILIDDGSTDNSIDICKEYEKKDNRIKVISKENAGSSSCRNLGLDIASGEYISFVDSDDWIDNNMLLETLNISEEYNSDIVISGINFDKVNSNGEVVGTSENNYKFSVWDSKDKIRKNIIKLFPNALINSSCNKLYKKDLLKKINAKFIKTNIGEDTSFNIDIIKYSNSIVVTNNSYYHYMRYESIKTLTSRVIENAYDRYLEIHNQMDNLFITFENRDEYIINQINKTMFSQYFATTLKILKADDKIYPFRKKKELLNMGLKEAKIIDTFDSFECYSYKEKIFRLIIKKRLYLLSIILVKI